MGDCCSASQPPLPQDSNSGCLTIYGDLFDRDTRSLRAICEMSEVEPDFQIIDCFNGSNHEADYVKMNWTKTKL